MDGKWKSMYGRYRGHGTRGTRGIDPGGDSTAQTLLGGHKGLWWLPGCHPNVLAHGCPGGPAAGARHRVDFGGRWPQAAGKADPIWGCTGPHHPPHSTPRCCTTPAGPWGTRSPAVTGIHRWGHRRVLKGESTRSHAPCGPARPCTRCPPACTRTYRVYGAVPSSTGQPAPARTALRDQAPPPSGRSYAMETPLPPRQ